MDAVAQISTLAPVFAAAGEASLILAAAMSLAWLIRQTTGNSGWIDMIWTLAVGLASIKALLDLPAMPGGALVVAPPMPAGSGLAGQDFATHNALPLGLSWRALIFAVLVGLWSLRLASHIFRRTLTSADDPRYAKLMADWGRSAPLRLFLFLQIQAAAGLVLVLALVLAAQAQPAGHDWGLGLATLLALIALGGEALADAQLAAYRRAPDAARLCRHGLWAYSRHPNYFCEWLFWFALSLAALLPPLSLASPFALLAPAMMYAILRYGSGVPHLEAHMLRTRPQAFAAYAAQVPVFFPRLFRVSP